MLCSRTRSTSYLSSSSLGVALSWLFVFDADALVDRLQGALPYKGMMDEGDEAATVRAQWRLLRRARANVNHDMERSFTQGILWTTGSAEEQLEARMNGLACFRDWFDATVITAAENHFDLRPGPWIPDDDRPAATPTVRSKHGERGTCFPVG